MDHILFFHTPKLESYIVPSVCTKVKNKIKSIGIPERADVGDIIPPNLYAKIHVLKKKVILQPRNNQMHTLLSKYNEIVKMERQWRR
jgi:hypothetical protein